MVKIIYENMGRNNEYCCGRYYDIDIIIIRENGYVNVSKLCADAGKSFRNWKNNKGSTCLLRSFSEITNIDMNEFLILIKEGCNQNIKGIYAHPKLIPHIAYWASFDFAYKATEILNDFLLLEKNDKIKKQEHELKIKNSEIIGLSKKIGELQDLSVKSINGAEKEIRKISNQNEELCQQNSLMLYNVNKIADRMTALTIKDEHINHLIIIVKNNDNYLKNSDCGENWNYQALHLTDRSYLSCIDRHKILHPNMISIGRINCETNSMNMWIRIKKQMASGKKSQIEVSGCKFNTLGKNKIDDVIKKMIAISKEKCGEICF